jgi:hypothetical protein
MGYHQYKVAMNPKVYCATSQEYSSTGDDIGLQGYVPQTYLCPTGEVVFDKDFLSSQDFT